MANIKPFKNLSARSRKEESRKFPKSSAENMYPSSAKHDGMPGITDQDIVNPNN